MPHVLIVDDERDLAELIDFNLRAAGFSTRVALTGEAALQAAREQPVDLVLLDVMLPDLSGVEVCRQLRAAAATRDVLIVMLTARGEEADLSEPVAEVLDGEGFTPNDPEYKRQWNLRMIHMPQAWLRSHGKGVVVAVLDTGVAYEDHGDFKQVQDLKGIRFKQGYDFVNDTVHANDDHGHGTHVAGTIAQATNNGEGVAGVAFEATLMPVKVLNHFGSARGVKAAGLADLEAAPGINKETARRVYAHFHPGALVEADVLARQLELWGIAPERIVREGRSRNTRENALESERLIREKGWRTLLLVTSAAHMPRALGTFEAVGLHPDTLVVDVRAHGFHPHSGWWQPRASNLSAGTDALRELFGRLVYRLRGWA